MIEDTYQNNTCVYCGANAQCRDHVISMSYLSERKLFDSNTYWIVDACSDCNMLAGNKVFFSIPEKAKFILSRFNKRYNKVLSCPEWTQKEINELDYGLQQSVYGYLIAKRVAFERQKRLSNISDMPEDYKMPDFIKSKMRQWQKEHREFAKELIDYDKRRKKELARARRKRKLYSSI